ncbi:hypothetical protein FN846DRAFT_788890, partial [Sphaerosporella brunnea]
SAVRGPNSALSEFLRERGINAAHIRARAREAANAAFEAQIAAEGDALLQPQQQDQDENEDEDFAAPAAPAASTRNTRSSNRKRKAPLRGRKRKKDEDSDGEDVKRLSRAKIPNPGQIGFCAECHSRFTVTAYSKANTAGDGLLCSKCGSKYAKEEKSTANKRTTNKRVKREDLRKALDNEENGCKSLREYTTRMIACNIDLVDGFGDMQRVDMDAICQIVCRNRTLDNNTLKLFFEPEGEKLVLYDCAKIDASELKTIADGVPTLKHLDLNHAGKMTDAVLNHFAVNLPRLEAFHLRGAFPISRQAYIDFCTQVGHRLKHLTISSTSRTSPEVIAAIAKYCPNLKTLDISNLPRLNNAYLEELKPLKKLTSLNISTLNSDGEVSDAAIVDLLNAIGSGLTELNISGHLALGDNTLSAIHACCASLRILNISGCEGFGDGDIRNLFNNWGKNKGLEELYMARITSLGDGGLKAAIQHSGATLEVLDLNSCNAVTKKGIMDAISVCKAGLRGLDLAFLRDVDDEVVETVWQKGVKGLQLRVWGCTKVTCACDVPDGYRLVGRESDISA